jgi:tRNA nucleotidyltransferase (CCA-adding enzyme)
MQVVMRKTLSQVLEKATPTAAERRSMESAISRTTKMFESMIKGTDVTYTLAGSFIRDTWMRDKKEFEIFIMFPEDTPRDKLERDGLEMGKSLVEKMNGTYRIAYAEHPYVRGVILGYDVDIVPCYSLKTADRIKSAVDRTPFHNKWIASHLKPKMSKEVRLLKQLAKAQGFYGSDTKTLGLSGYLCELLVIHYGSFIGFAEAASGWKPGEVFIDIQRHHESRADAMKSRRFEGQPLVVIDPVDRERNVAAVLSSENFNKIVNTCTELLEKPSISMFFPPKVRVSAESLRSKMKSRGTRLVAVRFARPDVIEDILWPQLRRTAHRICSILAEYEFVVFGSDVTADGECFMLIELEVWKLPKIRRLSGPGVFAKDHVEQFRKKYEGHGKLWIEDDVWKAEVKREFTDAAEKLRDSLSDNEDELKAKGIASYIASIITAKGFEVIEDDAILNCARRDNQFGLFLKKYLEKGSA